jgi:rfaE bifunctional protein kinase chain/domain
MMPQELKEKSSKILSQLSKLSGKKILVVGDVGLDEYIDGQVRRISPEAPVPVLEAENQVMRPGLSTNVAQNIRSLGGEPILVSVVGQDLAAEHLKGLLKQAQVNVESLVVDPMRPTTKKMRIMSGIHHIVRIDFERREFLSTETQSKVLDQIRQHIPKVDAVILQDYAKGVLSETLVQNVIELAQKHSKPVTVDPYETTPLRVYRGASLIKPNLKEALALAGLNKEVKTSGSDSIENVGRVLREGSNCPNIVITRSKEGMMLFEGNSVKNIPTFAQKVYDVTGAGDTVIAALTLGWVSGLTLEDSCILSNFAAGVVVGQIGCVPCSTAELIEFIRTHSLNNAFAN